MDAAGVERTIISEVPFDIDRLVKELGNIPGDFINQSLQALRPLQRSANKMRLLNNVQDDAFVKAHPSCFNTF